MEFSEQSNEHPILLFDGVCNLCHFFVQFVLQRDTKGVFRFASLQSETAQHLLRRYQFSQQNLDTVVLIENGKVYTHSDVAIRVVRHFSGLWPLLAVLGIIPSFIRNPIYNWIAANRYRGFGKQEQCLLPQPEWQDRFLDA
ncbi:MAG: DCC1-like thiol-disulfide oxidoreductase family protein [Bacteroidota bacterium]